MDFLAQNGYDVWAVDIHGYGHSEKTANDWIDSHSAAADIAAAVEYITKLRRVTKINLLGGSAGTQRIGVFTMDHPDKVAKLTLYAGFWKGRFRREGRGSLTLLLAAQHPRQALTGPPTHPLRQVLQLPFGSSDVALGFCKPETNTGLHPIAP